MSSRLKEIKSELRGYSSFWEEDGQAKDEVYNFGKELYDIGGIKLMDKLAYKLAGGIEYIWDGIGTYTLPSDRNKKCAPGPGIIGNWGSSSLDPPQTLDDAIGFVRYYERKKTKGIGSDWIKDNLKYDGEIEASTGWGYFNCRSSIKELQEKDIIVEYTGQYFDILLP